MAMLIMAHLAMAHVCVTGHAAGSLFDCSRIMRARANMQLPLMGKRAPHAPGHCPRLRAVLAVGMGRQMQLFVLVQDRKLQDLCDSLHVSRWRMR